VDLSAAEESGDLAVSLANVLDKLARQAQRHVGRLRERKRRPAGAAPVRPRGSDDAGREDGAPRVFRSRRFLAKPMTVEEAALEMGQSREGVVVFRDAVTERVSVLYRRSDGNLGLIEPEARGRMTRRRRPSGPGARSRSSWAGAARARSGGPRSTWRLGGRARARDPGLATCSGRGWR
jgi:hypothetical protein